MASVGGLILNSIPRQRFHKNESPIQLPSDPDMSSLNIYIIIATGLYLGMVRVQKVFEYYLSQGWHNT